jgi:hypothetical protein
MVLRSSSVAIGRALALPSALDWRPMKANHWSVGVVAAVVTTIALIPFLLATSRRPSAAPIAAPSGASTTSPDAEP